MMVRAAVLGILALGLATSATAFDAERLTIQVGVPPGGAYDQVARAAANHIARYLPGEPDVVVENVEGAGGLRLLNLYLAGGATDGSQIIMIGPAFVFDPIFNPDNATIDPREVNFLVSFSNYPSYCATTVASGITTFDQLITTPGVNVGAVSNSTSFFAANAVNRVFDADFNIVTGFAGISEIYLALARGELAAFCGLSHSSIAATEATVDINIVAELSPEPFGLVEGAEFVLDRVDDPATRDALGLVFSPNTIFYPMMAHPDTPDDIVAVLRDALFALATDEAFLAEMTTRGIDLSVTHGADVQVLVDQFLNTDPVIQAAARALVQ